MSSIIITGESYIPKGTHETVVKLPYVNNINNVSILVSYIHENPHEDPWIQYPIRSSRLSAESENQTISFKVYGSPSKFFYALIGS